MTRFLLVATLLAAASACHRSTPAPGASSAPATAAAPASAAALGKGDLEVVVNGKPSGAWTQAQIAAAAAVAMTNQNGEERQGWPLKPLAQTLVGGKARVVAVASAGERVPIDEKEWNDASRSLVLRLNHHGEYKAMWVDGRGNADEAFLKGVRRVEVVQ